MEYIEQRNKAISSKSTARAHIQQTITFYEKNEKKNIYICSKLRFISMCTACYTIMENKGRKQYALLLLRKYTISNN